MKILALALTLLACALTGCALFQKDVNIVDAKMVTAIDENFLPVKVTDVFPRETTRVSCWIRWRDSRINAQVVARWHYVTDDIHIIDRVFTIPKKDGMGSVALSMPEGKCLPSGSYRVELVSNNRVIESLDFKIQ